MLAANGFGDFEKIHISVDPVSARNPGYCFVDFPDSETAQRALSSLSVSIRDRPVKVGPCEPKKQRSRPPNGSDRFAFERWGDWAATSGGGSAEARATPVQANSKGVEQGPHGALNHFDDMVEHGHGHGGRRLYVGGLRKMIDQAQNNREISDIFADFNPCVGLFPVTCVELTPADKQNRHWQANHAARSHESQARQPPLLLRRL